MPTYGVTSTGFVIRTLENLNELVISAVQSAIGVLPVDSLLKMLQIINERFAELWQLGQAVYSAGDVDAATGISQDNINAITATLRKGATASTVTLSWTGNPGVVVTANARAKTNISLQVFTTDLNTGTIVAAPAYATTHTYIAGDRVANASRVYVATTGGLSGAGPGPTSTATSIPDGAGTLVWRFMGDGTGVVDVVSHALVTGPVSALSGSITVIDTFISGVLGVVNLLDAVVGTDVETNADYRVRRLVELAQPGSGTTAAVQAALSALNGTKNITVFQNTTDVVNVDGMPPHTVEALMVGGDDIEIATAILANVDGGINTTGNTTVMVTDPQGFVVAVKFSRPVQQLIYNTLTLNIDASKFPATGVQQVKDAIVAYGATVTSGDDVESTRTASLAFAVLGVRGFTLSLQSVFPVTVPVSAATIVITSRQVPAFDSSRIVVNTIPVTP